MSLEAKALGPGVRRDERSKESPRPICCSAENFTCPGLRQPDAGRIWDR
ncbi:hypothetical protein HMPREF0185_02055 [Brevundimonas diminuta 470-4]|nr:hypothetical protein HMPREF0185_02055 [Brevundimonas diminuta 470-4]